MSVLCVVFWSVLVKGVKGSLLDLPTSTSIGWVYGVGFMLGFVYCMQVVSGLLLSLLFGFGGSEGSFWAMVGVMQDVECGWVVRLVHSTGVSLFMLLLMLHVLKGMYYGSWVKSEVWLSGLVVLLMVVGSSFLGYVLPWGVMSYWGMTVVSSMVGVLPVVGPLVMEWLWGGSVASVSSLSRFFSAHYILSLAVALVVIVHLLLLHVDGSSNPMGLSSKSALVVFYPKSVAKDSCLVGLALLLYWGSVLWAPYTLMDSINFEVVDVLKTPTHIKPEWYLLFVYCMLRCVNSKLGGLVVMVAAFMVLAIFAFIKYSGVGRISGFLWYKACLWAWVFVFVGLSVLGGRGVEFPYEGLSMAFSFLYFWLLLLMCVFLMVPFNAS